MQDLTWKTLRDRLGKERDRLVAACPPISDLVTPVHPEEVYNWFSETNDETRDAVRTAVAQYVVTKKWPPLGHKEQAFILMRIEWGVWLANCLMTCPGMSPPSMDVPEEHVLSWFLLSSWECAGMAQSLIGLDLAAQSLQGCLSGNFDQGQNS